MTSRDLLVHSGSMSEEVLANTHAPEHLNRPRKSSLISRGGYPKWAGEYAQSSQVSQNVEKSSESYHKVLWAVHP